MHKNSWFTRFAKKTAAFAGKPATFVIAFLVVVLWAVSGPLFGFSDTWQLVINTSTTIITFLMVFLIQNTQNRDTEALQLKLDELIRVNTAANNSLLDLEELDEKDLNRIRSHFLEQAKRARVGKPKQVSAHATEKSAATAKSPATRRPRRRKPRGTKE